MPDPKPAAPSWLTLSGQIRLPVPGLSAPGAPAGWTPLQLWLTQPVPGLSPGPKGDKGDPGPPGNAPGPPIPTGDVDALPALQGLVDAAQAVTDADMTAAWTVRVPQAVKPYNLSGPLYLDGRNITLAGDGPGTRIAGDVGGYGGPTVVLGVSRLERMGVRPADYRIPGLLGGRAISTKGTAVLSVTAHPLQLGGNPDQGSLLPDYWQSPAYTFEFVAGPSNGAVWAPTVPLFGLSPATGGSWGFYSGQDMASVSLFVRRASQAPTQWDTFTIPTPGPWPHAVTAQWDSATATVTAWVDGVRQPVTRSATDGSAWQPGGLMARSTGDTPFRFGGQPGVLTPVDVHAFLVSVGKKYDPAQATETRLDGLPLPAPANRYVERPTSGPVACVACLPLDDVPATHVPVWSSTGNGVGFWIPQSPDGVVKGLTASNLAVRDLSVSARVQQAVAVGGVFTLRLTDLTATGGLQGVGATATGEAYPVVLRDLTASGTDCSYYGYRQILRATGTVLPNTGTEGVRCQGGDYRWTDTVSTFHAPTTRAYFHAIGDEYGGIFEVDGVQIDNEDGNPALAAVVDAGQAPFSPNRVRVRGVTVSTLTAGVFVRVYGSRTAASGDVFPVGLLDVSQLVCFAGFGGTVVQIDGTAGSWMGTFDPAGLNNANVAGHVENLTVLPLMKAVPAQ